MRLYSRALGTAFATLPPILQHFHTAPSGATAKGTLKVCHGEGWLRPTLARFLRLPPSGEYVPVCLRVEVQGEREHWIRTFGTQTMATTQWLDQGLLWEAAGPLRFVFRLSGDTEGMQFAFVRSSLLGLPLPRALSPRVEASVRADGTSWWLSVRVFAPLLGLLTHYEGRLELQ